VSSEIDGILSMTDKDAGTKMKAPDWGTNGCWVIPYALFYSGCPAYGGQSVPGKYLIADASIGGPYVSEGFYVDMAPAGEAICPITIYPNGFGDFTDFGNNTTYGDDSPGICNAYITS
jgi:hypothetical protein